MVDLLKVLGDGDPNLYGLACKTHFECSASISEGPEANNASDDDAYATEERVANQHLIDVFARRIHSQGPGRAPNVPWT